MLVGPGLMSLWWYFFVWSTERKTGTRTNIWPTQMLPDLYSLLGYFFYQNKWDYFQSMRKTNFSGEKMELDITLPMPLLVSLSIASGCIFLQTLALHCKTAICSLPKNYFPVCPSFVPSPALSTEVEIQLLQI